MLVRHRLVPSNGTILIKKYKNSAALLVIYFFMFGTKSNWRRYPPTRTETIFCWRQNMNSIIYLVGLVVVVLAILSFFGLH
jgi:hypothetical protein